MIIQRNSQLGSQSLALDAVGEICDTFERQTMFPRQHKAKKLRKEIFNLLECKETLTVSTYICKSVNTAEIIKVLAVLKEENYEK